MLEKNNYEGRIFKLYDCYFYIGIFNFYINEYESAMKNFVKAFEYKKLKFLNDIKKNNNKKNLDIFSELLDDSVNEINKENFENGSNLSDFENNSFCILDYYYNIAICQAKVK